MADAEQVQSVRRSRVSTRGAFVGISIALFLISLTQDGFYIDRADPAGWANCFGLLFIGALALFDGVFAWLANPMLALAWLAIWIPRLRFVPFACAVISLLFALSFLLHHDVLADEGGGRAAVTGYGWGYWLWIASISTMIIGSASMMMRRLIVSDSGDVLQTSRSSAPVVDPEFPHVDN